MVSLTALAARLREDVIGWRDLGVADLLFAHHDASSLMLIVLIGISVALLVARSAMQRKPGRDHIALPAILTSTRRSPLSIIRHGALLFFLAGLPFFALALAAPFTAVTNEEVTYPGRRIALLLDASTSMITPFEASRLRVPNAKNKAVFFTAVAAADTFIRQRINGRYRDLIALVEFGDEAYVVTPFTNDYDNILLSLSLIGDWTEFVRFPDQGTTIGVAIEQGTRLFEAFDFLDASGNLMLIFSDGQDTQVTFQGVSVEKILAGAMAANIPVYFIRTSFNRELGSVIPDRIWKPAVEATGGRFYPASKESDIVRALKEIDERSAGKIVVKQYSTQVLQFSPFATLAVGLWAVGLALKLTVPYFSKFP